MKFFAAALLVVLGALQYRLWISDDGARSVVGLRERVAEQRAENAALEQRNAQLAAEVADLKQGLSALEERARNDLGMIGASETFFQVADGAPAAAPPALPEPAAPDAPVVQRTAD